MYLEVRIAAHLAWSGVRVEGLACGASGVRLAVEQQFCMNIFCPRLKNIKHPSTCGNIDLLSSNLNHPDDAFLNLPPEFEGLL